MQRQFKGVFIPAEIWLNEELSIFEKHLFAEIDSFTKNGECFASNAYFAEFFGLSIRQIQRYLQALKEKNLIFIDVIYKPGTSEVEKRIIRPNYIKLYERPHDKNDMHPHVKSGANPPDGIDAPPCQNRHTPHAGNVMDINTCIIKPIINTENNKKNLKHMSKNGSIENEFEELWKIYPRKLGKKKALDSYKKARKTKKIPYETIENGLYRYISYLKDQETEEQFIMHGSTWFNQEKWQDEYSTIQTRKKPKNAFDYFQMQYGGSANESSRNGEIIDYHSEILPESFQGF